MNAHFSIIFRTKYQLKFVFLFMLLLSFFSATQAQDVFSLRSFAGWDAMQLSSVNMSGDTIMAMGFGFKNDDTLRVTSIYVEILENGDSIKTVEIDAGTNQIQAQHRDFVKNDEHLCFLSRTVDTSFNTYVTINDFNVNTRELDQTLYDGFYEKNGKFFDALNLPIEIFEVDNKKYLFYATRTEEPENYGQIGILVLDATDSLLASRIFGDPDENTFGLSVIQIKKGFVIGSKYLARPESREEVDERSELYFLDFDLNVTKHWRQEESVLQQGARAIQSTEDGGIIIATCKGKIFEKDDDPYRYEMQWTDGLLYKLDSNLNIEWETVFTGYDTNRSYQFVESLISLPDASGYVMAGQTEVIAKGPDFDAFDHQGWLIKINHEGDSIWERKFSPVNPPLTWSTFYDVAATDDGGVVAVGFSIGSGDQRGQAAWIIKTDEYGCIVPGCQFSGVDSREVQSDDLSLRVYPNPVSDILAIYVDEYDEDLQYELYDMQGKLMQSFRATTGQTTYLMHVHEFPAGQYILRATSQGRLVGTERVSIVR